MTARWLAYNGSYSSILPKLDVPHKLIVCDTFILTALDCRPNYLQLQENEEKKLLKQITSFQVHKALFCQLNGKTIDFRLGKLNLGTLKKGRASVTFDLISESGEILKLPHCWKKKLLSCFTKISLFCLKVALKCCLVAVLSNE